MVNQKKYYQTTDLDDLLDLMQKEVRKSEDDYNALIQVALNSSSGALIIKNDHIFEANSVILNLLDFTKSEFVGHKENEVSFITNDRKHKDSFKLLEQRELDTFEVIKGFYKKNGDILWAKTKIIALRDPDKQLTGHISIVDTLNQNYTENLGIDTLNTIAKSILGKEDIYDIAWDIAFHIATYLDTNDCVIYVLDETSQNLEQIAAYNNKSQGKKNILNKITIPLGQGIVGSVAKSGISEVIHDTSKDVRYIIDDDIRLSEITVPIKRDGKIIGIIDAEHERKNYFNKHQIRTLESIASLVALQLKSALNLRKLKEAQDRNIDLLEKLEKQNTELQEYAHVVSHDLKSPLRSISALATWIKLDNYDHFGDTSLQYFADLESTLETMENLISNILEYSSIRIDDQKIDNFVDLHKLVEELIRVMYRPEHISIQILNRLPKVKGDSIKFQQLFQNLLSNSIKFNDKELGIIKVDVKPRPSFYEFSVNDNGIGIEEKYFNKIFKIFQSLKYDKTSTGVGLSIVKKIVEIYKGEIWVESEIEKGTTFFFTIKK